MTVSLPTSYAQAAEYLGKRTSRNVPSKAATRVERRDEESISIIYQWTPVVTFRADGAIVLNTGGRYTHTTRQRMCDCLPSGIGVSLAKSTIWLGGPMMADDTWRAGYGRSCLLTVGDNGKYSAMKLAD